MGVPFVIGAALMWGMGWRRDEVRGALVWGVSSFVATLQDTVGAEWDGMTPCLFSGKGCQGQVLLPVVLVVITFCLLFLISTVTFLNSNKISLWTVVDFYSSQCGGNSGKNQSNTAKCLCIWPYMYTQVHVHMNVGCGFLFSMHPHFLTKGPHFSDQMRSLLSSLH